MLMVSVMKMNYREKEIEQWLVRFYQLGERSVVALETIAKCMKDAQEKKHDNSL